VFPAARFVTAVLVLKETPSGSPCCLCFLDWAASFALPTLMLLIIMLVITFVKGAVAACCLRHG
jgi:hypothetical protein